MNEWTKQGDARTRAGLRAEVDPVFLRIATTAVQCAERRDVLGVAALLEVAARYERGRMISRVISASAGWSRFRIVRAKRLADDLVDVLREPGDPDPMGGEGLASELISSQVRENAPPLHRPDPAPGLGGTLGGSS